MIRKIALVLTILCAATACGETSTEPSAVGQPASFDGGTLGGSGNREGTPPPPPPTGTATADAGTASADSTNRGGTLGGSGN